MLDQILFKAVLAHGGSGEGAISCRSMSLEGEFERNAARRLLDAARTKHGDGVLVGGFPHMLATMLGVNLPASS